MNVQSISANYHQKQVNYRKNQPKNFTSKEDILDLNKLIEAMSKQDVMEIGRKLSQDLKCKYKLDMKPEWIANEIISTHYEGENFSPISLRLLNARKINTIDDFYNKLMGEYEHEYVPRNLLYKTSG